MKLKINTSESLSAWYKTQSGQATLSKLDEQCAEVLSEIFGYYAIETGVLSGQHSLLQQTRIATTFTLIDKVGSNLFSVASKKRVEGDQLETFSSLISSNEQLPLATDNIDLVLGTHVLELSKDPHQVLREIDRVLVPEGHCILIGFNPFAISGLAKQLRSKISRKEASFKLRSASRVRDWFSLLGFEVLDVSYMGLRPNVKNKKIFESLAKLEDWAEIAGPLLGKLYMIHVKKQVVAMTPYKKVWRAPAVLSGGKVVLNNTAQKIRRENYSNY
jgi:ubiquinone/menaquinone biosynthesis C-methylase UbiE